MAPTVPPTSKAVLVEQTGGPELLRYKNDHPTPKAEEDQLLIHNKIIGVNFIDTYFRSGLYPLPNLPSILGCEAAGEVLSVGPTSSPLGFQPGDRVVWMAMGGYAEYTAAPADKTIKIPEGVSNEAAVGGFLMGMTALSLIREAYPVQRGDWILIHAAAGGTGLLMCQLLKAAGAHVIGTAGGPEKGKLALENGAEYVIDYKDPKGPNWVDEVKRLTDGEGVAAVYDSVGKDTWEGSLDAVRRKGKVVFFGNASGPVPPFPVSRLAERNISIARPRLHGYIHTREEFEGYANELFRVVKSGELKIRIHGTYRLEDVQTAHRDLEGRKTSGKLLLKP